MEISSCGWHTAFMFIGATVWEAGGWNDDKDSAVGNIPATQTNDSQSKNDRGNFFFFLDFVLLVVVVVVVLVVVGTGIVLTEGEENGIFFGWGTFGPPSGMMY
jgi:hypothetical protein